MTTKPEVTLGRSGPRVFPIALGCMGMGAGSRSGDSDESPRPPRGEVAARGEAARGV